MKDDNFVTIKGFPCKAAGLYFFLCVTLQLFEKIHLHLCGCRSAVVRPAAYRRKVRTACSNARLIRYGRVVGSGLWHMAHKLPFRIQSRERNEKESKHNKHEKQT